MTEVKKLSDGTGLLPCPFCRESFKAGMEYQKQLEEHYNG